MNGVTQAFALIEGLIYVAVGPLEALFLRSPAVQRLLRIPKEDVPAVMMWAIPLGVRNVLIGAGVIIGVVLYRSGQDIAGQTLVLYGCAYMVIGGLAMAVADALGHYSRRGESIPGTIGATLPAAIALVAAAW